MTAELRRTMDDKRKSNKVGVGLTGLGRTARRAARIRALARTFPALDAAPGVDPWDPDRLDNWAFELLMHRAWGRRAAAQFVLAVWDRDRPWRCGRFEAVSAAALWRPEDRAAFAAWAGKPWWP